MPDGLSAIALVHAASTWFMVGLIWFVQVVHYPLTGTLAAERLPAYARQHQRLTTFIVAPAMLMEAATGIALAVLLGGALAWIGLALLVIIWISTYALQVPCHRRLADAHDASVCRRLVRTNWIRTVAWTLRGLIALAMLIPR
jgi:hypothetical protein